MTQKNLKVRLIKILLNIDGPLTLKQVRKVYSRKNEQKYLEMALKTLNKLELKLF